MKTNDSPSFFSKKPVRIGLLVLLAILVALYYKYCRTNGPELREPIQAPVAIAFIDANRFLNTQIPNVRVTLIDNDSMVVSSNGFRFSTIDIPGGVMSLGLKKAATFSAEKPYRFIIKAEAEGYSTNYRSILITEDKGIYVPIFLARIDDPPAGMAGFDGMLNIENSQSLETQTLVPDFANNFSDPIEVEIPEGTLFMRDQCLVSDDVDSITYRFSFGSPRNIAAGRTFPGGQLVTDAIDLDGKTVATPDAPFFFASAGWLTLEMKAGQENINRFSKPIRLQLPISDSLLNPKTSQPYKAGQKVDIWSLNEQGIWMQDSAVTVQNGPSGLFVNLRIQHLSTWNIDSPVSPCAADVTVSYTNSGITADYYSELIQAQNGLAYGIAGPLASDDNTLTYAAGGGSFSLARAPGNTGVEFRVYDNPTVPTNLLVSTGIFQTCNNPASFDLPTTSTPHTVNLEFAYRSSGTDHPICDNAVWFTECSTCASASACESTSNAFHYGGILVSGGITGAVTLQRNTHAFTDAAHAIHCIRLWYTGMVGMAVVSHQIDFNIDFSDTSTRSFSANVAGLGTANIDYSHTGTAHRFVFTSGLPVLSSCIP